MDLTLVLDNASVELFADGGLSVMTQIFFPDKLFSRITLESPANTNIGVLEYSKLKGAANSSSVAVR